VLGVIVAREQEQGPFPLELGAERIRLALEVRLRLRVRGIGEQIHQLEQGSGACFQRPPQADLLAQALCLPEDLLREALVVPEAGLAGTGVQDREAGFLGG
jgi:hypothetical protein